MSEFSPRPLEDLLHEFPPDIEHLSATGMKVALRCAEQYRRIYVKGQRRAPSLALVAGRADHKAIEQSLKAKMESGESLPSPQVEVSFLQMVEETVEQAGGLRELEDAPDVARWDQVRIVGMDGVRKYNDIVSPTLTPMSVEEPFTIEVPGLSVPLIGYIDLTAFAGSAGALQMIDRKRTGRAMSRIAPDWLFQASVYQLAKPLPHAWHVTVAPKSGKAAALLLDKPPQEVGDTKVMQRQVAMIAAQIGFLYQRYGPDEVWPATGVTHPFACSYCGFRPECWAWQ